MKDIVKLINAWNTSRLDLFSITLPNENGEYFGVIRFYYQGPDGKYFSKCVRISDTATARHLVDVLVDKFHPDLRKLPNGRYALYEQHSNFGERRMAADECPLKNQLNFALGNSEVRYILRDESRLNRSNSFQNMNAPDPPTIITNMNDKIPNDRKGSKQKKKDSSNKVRSRQSSEPPMDSSKSSIRLSQNDLTQSLRLNDVIYSNGNLRVNCSDINPNIDDLTVSIKPTDNSLDLINGLFDNPELSYNDPRDCVLVLTSIRKNSFNGSTLNERFIRSEEYPVEVYRNELKRLGPDYSLEFQLKRKPQNFKSRQGSNSQQNSLMSIYPIQDHCLVIMSEDKAREFSLNSIFGSTGQATNIKIGSSFEVTGKPPNIFIDKKSYPDIRPIHCSILLKRETDKLIISPALDASTRPPGPAHLLLNETRVSGPTVLKNHDQITLGNSGLKLEYVIRDPQSKGNDQNNYSSQKNLNDNSIYSPLSVDNDTSTNDNLPLHVDVPTKMKNMNQSPSIRVDVLERISELFMDHGCETCILSRPKFKLSLAYSLYLLLRLAVRNYYPKHPTQLRNFVNKVSSHLSSAAQNSCKDVPKEDVVENNVYWLSNTSEFLHIIKNDEIIQTVMSQGSGKDPKAYDILTTAIDFLFQNLRNHIFKSLEHLYAGFLFTGNSDFSENLGEDETPKNLPDAIVIDPADIDFSLCDGYLKYLLQSCSFVMGKFRKGSLNPYLTFQLFAQLFHTMSAWIFNAIITLEDIGECDWLTRTGSKKLLKRLDRVKYWAKSQGLEESSQCHLLKATQLCELVLADRSKLEGLYKKSMSLLSLNSIQTEWILAHLRDGPPISDDWIDVIITGAKNVNDEAQKESISNCNNSHDTFLTLHEPSDLSLPLFVPTEGYAIDATSSQQNVKFRTDSVIEFLRPSVDKNDILLSRNADKSSRNLIWNAFLLSTPEDADFHPGGMTNTSQEDLKTSHAQPIYCNDSTPSGILKKEMANGKNLKTFQPNLDYQALAREANLNIANITPILLKKTTKSIGLSILAAKPIGAKSNYGIYVKEVLPNGSADIDGRISVGDQLLAIGEASLIGVEKSEEVGEIMQANTRKDNHVPIVIGKEAAMHHGVYHLLDSKTITDQDSNISEDEEKVLSSLENLRNQERAKTPDEKAMTSSTNKASRDERTIKSPEITTDFDSDIKNNNHEVGPNGSDVKKNTTQSDDDLEMEYTNGRKPLSMTNNGIEIETHIENSLPPLGKSASTRSKKGPILRGDTTGSNSSAQRDKSVQYFSVYDNNSINDPYESKVNNVIDSVSKGSTNDPVEKRSIDIQSSVYDNFDDNKSVLSNRSNINSILSNKDRYLNSRSRMNNSSPSPPPKPTAEYPQYHPPERLTQPYNNAKNRHVDLTLSQRLNEDERVHHDYQSTPASPNLYQHDYSRSLRMQRPNPVLEMYTEPSHTIAQEQHKETGGQYKSKVDKLVDQLIKMEASSHRDQRAIDRLKIEIQFQSELEDREKIRSSSLDPIKSNQASSTSIGLNNYTRKLPSGNQDYDNIDYIPEPNNKSQERQAASTSRNSSLDRLQKKSVSFDRNLPQVNLYSPPSNNTTTNTLTGIQPSIQTTVHQSRNQAMNHIQVRSKDNGITIISRSSSPIPATIQQTTLVKDSGIEVNQDVFHEISEAVKDKHNMTTSNSENEFTTISKKQEVNIINRNRPENAENLSFKEKIRLFARDIGENEPKNRVKASKRQIQIENQSIPLKL